MTEPEFLLTPQLPLGYRKLLWETFFEERQRGFSLEDHFPQTATPTESVSYCVFNAGGETVGGLMVRILPASSGELAQRAASIGLVCVAKAHRGNGLSKRLLGYCIDALEAQGVQAMTLWTGKPEVYTPLGFERADATLSGWVNSPESARTERARFCSERWPDLLEHQGAQRGLPPFGLAAQRVSCPNRGASVVVLADPSGLAAVEWSGPEDVAADILLKVMPRRWRLHARSGDGLPTALRAAGATLALSAGTLQMWRTTTSPSAWTAKYALRVLDRI